MRKLSSAFVLALLIGTAGTASAQTRPRGFALNRYEPSERGSDWFALDSLDLRGRVRPAVGLTISEDYHPLVAYDQNGKYFAALIRHQFWVDPSASLVLFDRVRLSALVPIAAYAKGTSVTTDSATFKAPGGNIGDVRLAADVRLFGQHGDVITGALGSALYLPTGSRDHYTSDGNVRFAPRFSVAGDYKLFTYSGRAAFHYRPLTESFDRNPLGSQIELGLAAGIRIHRLVVGPEIYGSSVLDKDAFLKKRGTPVEVILGAHYVYRDFRFGAGGGGGVTQGWGSPAFRALLSAEWAPAVRKKQPPPPPPPVLPPPEPTPTPTPRVVVVPPPPPPPDRDSDGIADAKDVCPDQAGVASTDPTANGCPPDRDGDGVEDKDDACPDLPGPGDANQSRNGCPLARIENGQIRIADQVRFKTGSAEILRESDPVLLAIASTMKMHPEIRRVRIEGHTDNMGTTSGNQQLSQKRAESVVLALVRNGVDKSRLQAKGVGEGNPLASNSTEAGRTANRRVEIHIVDK